MSSALRHWLGLNLRNVALATVRLAGASKLRCSVAMCFAISKVELQCFTSMRTFLPVYIFVSVGVFIVRCTRLCLAAIIRAGIVMCLDFGGK
jgi:hypothetical protein